MKKLISNYHTHTKRCGHAYNEDEEYVLKAIEHGYKNLGFSDHAPFKNVTHESMRMSFDEDFPDYLNSLRKLNEKYKDKINIFIGLEIEYIEDRDNYYKELYDKYGLDYMIIGQHCYYDKNNNFCYYFHQNDYLKGLIKYKNDLIKGIKSGYFNYVAHPDLFFNRITTITPEIDQIIEEICLAAKRKDIPLEININGDTNNKYTAMKFGCLHYPSPYFFKKAKEIGNKFIFGVDAHAIMDFEKINYDYFDKFLKETGISEEEIIKELDFKKNKKIRHINKIGMGLRS